MGVSINQQRKETMRDFTNQEPSISALHTALQWHLYAKTTKSEMMKDLAQYQCEGWKSIVKEERNNV